MCLEMSAKAQRYCSDLAGAPSLLQYAVVPFSTIQDKQFSHSLQCSAFDVFSFVEDCALHVSVSTLFVCRREEPAGHGLDDGQLRIGLIS
jgi:hypothetical protein